MKTSLKNQKNKFLRLTLTICLLIIIPLQLFAQVCQELIWSDEFNGSTLDLNNWHHQTLGPNGGQWFNGELQHYTDDSSNSFVSNGELNIVAIKETTTQNDVTLDYTSARLNSKIAFTYGRVDVRAKLPFGNGTWPAIWTLGKNINEPGAYWETQGFGTTSWPACGELDIMEHGLHATNEISCAIHTPSSFGNTVNTQVLPLTDVANNYHVYSMDWSPDQITFLVDDIPYYTYNPPIKDESTWPFDLDQYLILNVAMGGISGNVDPGFTQSSMVIDYVRVYNEPENLTISGQQPMVDEDGLQYRTFDIPNANYIWTVPSDATITSGQGTNEITVNWGCTLGDVSLELQTTCGITNLSYKVTSFVLPVISGQPSIPSNTTNRIYSIDENAAYTYTWTVPADVDILSGQGTSVIEVDFGTASGIISVTLGSSCSSNTYDFPFVIEESFLYADFDNIDLEFIPYDGVVFQEVNNPSPSEINTSNFVGRVNKTVGSTPFAGIEADVYEVAFDLRPVMTQKVFSSVPGVVRFMLDDETTGAERIKISLDYGPGDVNQWVQLVYDFTGAPTETYDQLRLTYNHGNTTTEFWYFDDVMGHTDAFLNIITEEMTKVVEIYPNPSSGLFYINTNDIFSVGSTYELEVFDVQGRFVLNRQFLSQGRQVTFDLSDKTPGLYFVRLSGRSLQYVKAIVKK